MPSCFVFEIGKDELLEFDLCFGFFFRYAFFGRRGRGVDEFLGLFESEFCYFTDDIDNGDLIAIYIDEDDVEF